MEFRIDQSVFALYPDLQVAALVVRGMTNGTRGEELAEEIAREEAIARSVFSAVPVAEHPNILTWRAAYRTFGSDSHYRSSVEALTRRTIKGEGLPSINALVDIYNLISLKYLVPVGGEDLRHVRGDIRLTVADGTESFYALGHTENDPPHAGEVIYRDGLGCLCRRFNWREAERTKLTAATHDAFLSIEGLPPVNAIEVKEAAAALAERIEAWCGGSAKLWLLNHTVPSFSYTL